MSNLPNRTNQTLLSYPLATTDWDPPPIISCDQSSLCERRCTLISETDPAHATLYVQGDRFITRFDCVRLYERHVFRKPIIKQRGDIGSESNSIVSDHIRFQFYSNWESLCPCITITSCLFSYFQLLALLIPSAWECSFNSVCLYQPILF